MTVIATDLDGTLLRTDSTLSSRTRAALRSAREEGMRVVVATARPYRVVDRLFGDDQLIEVAVCGNGSGLYEPQTRRMTFTHVLDADVLRHVMDTVVAHVDGAGFAVETGHRVLFEPGYSYRHSHDDDRVPVDTLLELVAEPSVELMVWLPDRDPEATWARLSPLLGGVIECSWSADRGPLEIAAPGVTKAVALERLCRSWGMTAEDVIAFGDSTNDVPMLAWAGRSYAMANGNPAARAAATHLTAGNDDDGVAMVIEELLAHAHR